MEIKKSYYAIIPANVRYDERLTPNAKLLYGEVTALCNEKGYCWASNSYFAELYGVSLKSVSRWINQLIEMGYLTSDMIYKNGSKEIQHRYLRISEPKIEKEVDSYGQKSPDLRTERSIPYGQKSPDPMDKKVKDNNTINNTINNTYNNKQMSNKLPEKELKSDFDSIWKEYPNKKGKVKAFTAYKKAIKDGVDNQSIIDGISAYKKEIDIKRTDTEYIAHGSTWFSQKRWEDDYQTNGKVINSTFAQEAPTSVDNLQVSDEEERMYQEYLKKQGEA